MVALALHIGNVWPTVNTGVTATLPKRLIVQSASRQSVRCQCGLSTGVTGC